MANSILLSTGEPSLAFLCFFGIAIVFAGLIVLIALITLMNYLLDRFSSEQSEKTQSASVPVAQAQAAPTEIPNRGELVAAICAAIAEEEGTDISAIRVLSFKKIN